MLWTTLSTGETVAWWPCTALCYSTPSTTHWLTHSSLHSSLQIFLSLSLSLSVCAISNVCSVLYVLTLHQTSVEIFIIRHIFYEICAAKLRLRIYVYVWTVTEKWVLADHQKILTSSQTTGLHCALTTLHWQPALHWSLSTYLSRICFTFPVNKISRHVTPVIFSYLK